VRPEARICCVCCWEVRGEAEGAAERRWRVRTETGALRADGEELGVWGEVDGCVGEVGAAGNGVVQVEGQRAGREEVGGSSIGVLRTGRSFACQARHRMACGGVGSAGMSARRVPMPGCTWLGSIWPPPFALTAARTAPSDSWRRANCGTTGWWFMRAGATGA
jgi:hypothetical protein